MDARCAERCRPEAASRPSAGGQRRACVDRRVVVNVGQARELLTAVTYVGRRGKDGRRAERLQGLLCLPLLRRVAAE